MGEGSSPPTLPMVVVRLTPIKRRAGEERQRRGEAGEIGRAELVSCAAEGRAGWVRPGAADHTRGPQGSVDHLSLPPRPIPHVSLPSPPRAQSCS